MSSKINKYNNNNNNNNNNDNNNNNNNTSCKGLIHYFSKNTVYFRQRKNLKGKKNCC